MNFNYKENPQEKDFLSQFQVTPMNPLSTPCNLYDSERHIRESMPCNLYYSERYIKEKKIQEECENVEWEQDMGAHIPFCKLDGEICNAQCMRVFEDRN